MRDFAKGFYTSKPWINTRKAYAKSVGGLCEDCLKRGLYTPGEIVHHMTHITPENINDQNITLAWTNLKLVCRECHANEHKSNEARFIFDDEGNIIER